MTTWPEGSLVPISDFFKQARTEPWEEHIHGDRNAWMNRTEAEHSAHLEAQRADAEKVTNGNMVSPEGKAKGIRAEHFFQPGSRRSIERWGTPEMKTWHGSDNAPQVGGTSTLGKMPSLTEYRRQTREDERAAYHAHGGEEFDDSHIDYSKFASKDWEAIGRQEHPNVDHYQSGGIGHREGDESKSTVGFLPTHLVRSYREHGGDWNPDSHERVAKIKADLDQGKGLSNPVQFEYDHKEKWGYVGEGNHRVEAAHQAGLQTVPVRVYGRGSAGDKKRQGVGGPMEMKTDFGRNGFSYTPPDVHPDHFVFPGGSSHQHHTDPHDPELRALLDRYAPKTGAVLDTWAPSERLFAPTKGGVDPRLFNPETRVMKASVRAAVAVWVNEFFERHGYQIGGNWFRTYLAGSQASEWYGNNDFDILVGIEYDRFRRMHMNLAHLSNEEIGAKINGEFREDFNDEQWHPPFDRDAEWHLTGYINPNSWDIRKIKPYAAYNVTDNVWAVDPIHEPTGHYFNTTEMYYFEGVAAQVRSALNLHEPQRRIRCTQLWTFIHTDRSRAFGPHGSGAFDRGNALEKYLDQAPSGDGKNSLMAALSQAKFAQVTAAEKPTLYHGTDSDLEEGAVLEGGHGHPASPRVWLTNDPAEAATYGAHVYEVEAEEAEARPVPGRYTAPSAKVIRRHAAESKAPTRAFYLPEGGGKYHRHNPITGQALCRATILLDTTAMPFHVSDDAVKVHPMVCRRCLGADHPANQKQGSVIAHRGHDVYGSNNLDRLFPEGSPITSTPWPMAPRTKTKPIPYSKELLGKALMDPGKHMDEVDPRHLHAYQASITRAGVNYYMGDHYKNTGETFADGHHAANQVPVIYTRHTGESIILAGHHRAAAALLKGEKLQCMHVREEAPDGAEDAVRHADPVPRRASAAAVSHGEGEDGSRGTGGHRERWYRRVAARLLDGGRDGADDAGREQAAGGAADPVREDGLTVEAWYRSDHPIPEPDSDREEFGPDTEGVKEELNRLRGGPSPTRPELMDHLRNGTVPKHLYRAISESDFHRAKSQGYLDTHGEKNWMRPEKGEHAEGMVTATDPHVTARNYLPPEGGRVVKIETHSEHGWRPHALDNRPQWQTKTHDTKIPWEHVVDHSAPIKRLVNPDTWSDEAVRLEHEPQPPLDHTTPDNYDYFKRMNHPSFHHLHPSHPEHGKTAATSGPWKHFVPDPPPEGKHAIYRGLYLGSMTNSTFHPPDRSKPKPGIGHTTSEPVDHTDDQAVLDHLKSKQDHYGRDFAEPEHPAYNRRAMFGRHWTESHSLAQQFALDSSHGQYRAPGMPKRPTWGAVLEAHSSVEPEHDSLGSQFGETEAKWPGRDKIESVKLHLHHYDPEHPKGARQDTYQRTIEIPQEHWKNASLQATAGLFGPEWYETAHDDEIDAHPAADSIRSRMATHTSPQGHVYRLYHDSSKYVHATYLGKGENRIKKPQIVGSLTYFGGKANSDNNIQGRIHKVFVKPAHQRRGIASAMLDHAREMKSPNDDIEHSSALSEDGKAWADKKASKGGSIEVAGVVIKAEDTGRVLMLQRSFDDESDPARGTWEFPGGHIDEGENPFQAARREWGEETGGTFPDEAPVVGNWISNGMYQGFIVMIPKEGDLDINLDHEDRQVLNPDDPDGDGIEVVAWWDLKHLKDNPAVRKEVTRGTDWAMLKKAKLPDSKVTAEQQEAKVALLGRVEAMLTTATRGLGWHHVVQSQRSTMYPIHPVIESYVQEKTGVHPRDMVWSAEPYAVADAEPDPHGIRSRSRLDSAEKGYRENARRMPPVIAIEHEGKREHVDGWHRLGGAERAGLTHVPAYVGRVRYPQEHERAADGPSGQPGPGLGQPRGGDRGPSSAGLAGAAGLPRGAAGGPGGLSDLAERGYNTDGWKRWQQGACHSYAKGLIDLAPHLRAGALVDSQGHEQHFFVHDGRHAYDSAGRHPMPYTGVHKDSGLTPLADVDLTDYDEDGDESDVEQAKAHAQAHGILEGRYGPHSKTASSEPASPGVTWHPKAAKDLKALDKPVQKQLLQTIDGITSGHPTTLAQTHPLAGPMKGWYATKVSRGHRIIHQPNDSGGIHIGYVGLHEYDKAIQRLTSLEPDHESYYHITEDPHFKPRADHVPTDNALSMNSRTKPGLFVTKDPNAWAQSHGYQRPYLAEVHVPKGTGAEERWGNEHFVKGEDLHKVKVHRVIPLDEHIRENYHSPGRIESWHGTSHDDKTIERGSWGHTDFADKHKIGPGYKYSGPDVRDMPHSEHKKHYERWRDYMVGGGNEGHQFGHNEFDDKKMSLGGEDRDDDYDDDGQFIMRDHKGKEIGRKWSSKTAGKNGADLTGLSFHHLPYEHDPEDEEGLEDEGYHHGGTLIATHPEHGTVGAIHWTPSNRQDEHHVSWVSTHPEHKRRGVARQLFSKAQGVAPGSLLHSDSRSDEGDSWAQADGATPRKTSPQDGAHHFERQFYDHLLKDARPV